MDMEPPFSHVAAPVGDASALRRAITAAYRRPEAESLAPLLDAAHLPRDFQDKIRDTARELVAALRSRPRSSGVEALVHEYALSSNEGVALMCLAEALLRIPDDATRDALIRDKIGEGDWIDHLGSDRPLFVNAATWGLVVTGKLVASVDARGLGAALTRLLARAGEPVIRRAVDAAMRLLGEQFVTGETIEEALANARRREAQGFRYSYDMLGEAAMTAADASVYFADYEAAIHAIGRASDGQGPHQGPGISIKLSALHPRYSRAQAGRVMGELLPCVRKLAMLAKNYDIGFNIDAEEADRLELSLDILESLALDPALSGWSGLGFVVQAYGKRCPYVLDWIIDLARRADRRIMVRLVKGAYWDAEIKRAQIDGMPDFPVFTRKVHTDVAYIACARKLLMAKDAVFPQFATHNAQTVASIYHMAGPGFAPGDYEFQCLHGMGEPLYEWVIGPHKLDRPCRIYAPVGSHDRLLAYLVRRLLENGANASFVNRIADPGVSVDELVADPVEVMRAQPAPGSPHEHIASPGRLYPDRLNSEGIDLSDEDRLSELTLALQESAAETWAAGHPDQGAPRMIVNPADHRDRIGTVFEIAADAAPLFVARAGASDWGRRSVDERAAMLERAADAMQQRMATLVGLIVREAGRSIPDAIWEVREAIDFLRYYAAQARTTLLSGRRPLGPTICISPWNFPLAIFTGQIAAALAAGNPVLAKPAEETPLIAAEAVRLLHAAGAPENALQLLPGDGKIGAALVAQPAVAAVMFTGSTEVARLIQAELSARLSADGRPIPFIAETGGQNVMIVDSSALPEQVVADVITSAFDSAGQRCSALRILCLQDDIAERILAMLKEAMEELRVGRPDRLATDVGPVIAAQAQARLQEHIDRMRWLGRRVEQWPLAPETRRGFYVAPTIIEIDRIADVDHEVFGPVLHILRYRRDAFAALMEEVNATGYGLTFGLHTRLDESMEAAMRRVRAGNLYINRNMIGAVVGVQPFGGNGLSGTGPKAGGPLYLRRLVTDASHWGKDADRLDPALLSFAEWLNSKGETEAAREAIHLGRRSLVGREVELPGPVGERNLYLLRPRGAILLKPQTQEGLFAQMAAVLATGNKGVLEDMPFPPDLPQAVARRFTGRAEPFAAVLVEGDKDRVITMARRVASMPGAIIPVHAPTADGYPVIWLLEEISTSINTAAAGGNASLMTIA